MAEPYAPGSKEWWIVRQVANGDARRQWFELTDEDRTALGVQHWMLDQFKQGYRFDPFTGKVAPPPPPPPAPHDDILRRSYRFARSTRTGADLEVRERDETVAIVMLTETLVDLTPEMARTLAGRLYEWAGLVDARAALTQPETPNHGR